MCTTYFINRLQGRMPPQCLATVAIFGAAQVQGGTLGGLYSGSTYTLESFFGGGEELGGGRCDVALPLLVGEHRAATLTQPR
jgi:hypothetical protein